MTRIAPVLLVVLVALFAVARAEDKKDEKKDEKKPITFESKEGKFTVTLADKPKEDKKEVDFGNRKTYLFMFTVSTKEWAQHLTYIDYTKDEIGADADAFLAERLKRNIGPLKGKTVSEDKVTVGKQKFPGRDVVVELGDKRVYRARVVLAGTRLYQIVALGSDEFAKSKATDEFFKSFTIAE